MNQQYAGHGESGIDAAPRGGTAREDRFVENVAAFASGAGRRVKSAASAALPDECHDPIPGTSLAHVLPHHRGG
jgi:hypothetical protein